MIQVYTTYEGQNIIDLALQLYGNPQAFFVLLDDNPTLSLDEEIAAGTKVRYDPDKVDIRDYPLVKYFQNKLPQAVIVKTGN
ncbi:hypothetical protein [Microscilla marina]|uniref:LysM domain-containing protein n=1 Tax=Microscilla marina ATCC 23134 TaxID=313606 RepID=A1ZMF1_MICM2|nr:hypothetical protein [Microscilla marina]EAY26090.1 hypothetical protein M23134_06439 [Microscilla marina ATCC 23134]EAY28331.1 hypothetical protein M23134_03883 [Microscilla marina ATCC 23134]